MAAPQGRIVTFYSYKGGTGRSMALANFAWILAASGRSVLTIDWDLEAPGLHRFFRPFLTDPDLFETDGLIDTFWEFAASALASSSSPITEANGNQIAVALDDTKRRLNSEFFATGGYIDFVGAGRQGATYSERVNTFDWKRFYELGGADMLIKASAHLRSRYNWILIDSRTGVSDTSGICTMQLPDTVVACFTMNRQSIDGVDAVIRSIKAFRSPSIDGRKITFFPLATRIENAESVRLDYARTYARGKLKDILPATSQWNDRDYWDDMEIAYRPWYAFEEVIAAFGDATGATKAKDTMLSQMETMGRRIAGDDTLRVPEILTIDRAKVLSKYAFSSLTIPGERATPTTGPILPVAAEQDTGDTEFLRTIIAKQQIWQKSDFSWRYLLSRRELDLLSDDDRKRFGRNVNYYVTNSERGQKYIRTLSSALLLNCMLTLTGTFLFVYFATNARLDIPIEAYPVVLGFAFVLWLVSAAFVGAFVTWLGNPPYGFRFVDSIRRLLIGQLDGSIRDYDPDDRRYLHRSTS